ncbi:site-specific integrase [Liquorilactobacillus nagelii]|jgi:integrase|uniref:Tyr recombinase domain-containing protein n=2 Tax=Liquorilactobacillus nagelii TaxID=82688 RepID=A0A3S6QXD4_9LACO|nr:hypothetical protein BSQ50_09125 [Liquorilactobacillus nagelii]MCC7616892.1 hypothetical protein [Liquorilactobacillus nagelii]MCP9315685.1 site-specific integrase [Liquorilactobacillus nagelii]
MSKVVQWMNFHRRELFRRGIKNPQQLLFLNHDAQLPNAGSINASYRQIQKRLKIESKFSTHTMRHTLASMMLASGKVSILYIAHFLGHSSPAITQKYYIGLLPEQVENEGPKVVKIIRFG